MSLPSHVVRLFIAIFYITQKYCPSGPCLKQSPLLIVPRCQDTPCLRKPRHLMPPLRVHPGTSMRSSKQGIYALAMKCDIPMILCYPANTRNLNSKRCRICCNQSNYDARSTIATLSRNTKLTTPARVQFVGTKGGNRIGCLF